MTEKFITRDKATLLKFRNVAKDFEADFVFLGKTKSGRLKVGEVTSAGPQGFGFVPRIAKSEQIKAEERFDKKSGVRHKVHLGGSPFNSYFLEEFD